MSEMKIENLNDLCRICLRQTDIMHPIIEIDQSTKDCINFSLDFKIMETFTSLTTICNECKTKLDDFTLLISISKTTQMILRNLCDNVLEDDHQLLTEPEEGIEEIKDDKKEETHLIKSQITYNDIMKSIKTAKTISYDNLNCVSCNFIGVNLKGLISHFTIVHKELKSKWCPICNRLIENLTQHKKNHSKSDLTCRFCFKSFTLNEYLIKHLLSHLNEEEKVKRKRNKNEKNNGKVGDSLVSLENEVKNAENEVKNAENEIKNAENEIKNLENKFKNLENKLCNVCGKQFSNNSKLLTHLRSHSKETPFHCGICNKKLKTRSHLRQHENIHREFRRYICNVCGKSFNQSSTLNTHLKLHGDKDKSCPLCEKNFCRSADLKTHLRTHTGEKPFQCTICEASFVQKSHLTEHEKKHLDIKPYKCSFCEKCFAQKSTLKSHIDIHLGVKPFRCNLCPYAARQSFVLKTHMKQHESINVF